MNSYTHTYTHTHYTPAGKSYTHNKLFSDSNLLVNYISVA